MKFGWFLLTGVVIVAILLWMRRRDECTVLRHIPTDDGVIEIVDAACKEGLPHTTGPNTIRMTEAAYASPRRDSTLVHERVHLDQRRHRHEWLQFYEREWGYKLLPKAPFHCKGELRPNPDTADAPYAVWKDRYVFYPIYSQERTLRGAKVKVWDLVKGAFVDVPEAWRAFFCESADRCVHQYEHPHEIAAEYIAEGSRAPAAQKLFAWKQQR